FGKIGQIGNADAAMAPVPLPELLRFKVFPIPGVDHFTAHQLLNKVSRWSGNGTLRSGAAGLWIGIFPVDPGDAPSQRGELFLDILHTDTFAFSLPNIAHGIAAEQPCFLPHHCYIQEVIKSALIPVAGFGTRLLPATKSQPKEMLPV